MSSHHPLPEHDDSATAATDAGAPAPGTTAVPAPRRRLRTRIGAVLLALPLLAGGGVATAAAHKSVELDLDGEIQTVSTFAGSVEGVLDEQGVDVGEHDLLAPAPAEAVSDGSTIVVRTATQIEVQVDGETREVWTTAQTTGQALATVAEAGREITVVASRSLDGTREALDMPLVVDGPVDLVVDGVASTVEMTGEAYLADVLAAAGLALGKLDHVVVEAGADGTPEVHVTRIQHALRAETESVPFETVERADDSLYVGERRVVQEGREGVLTRIRATRTVGGAASDGEPTDGIVTTAPVDRIVAVGTQDRPAPAAPAPTPARAAASASGSAGSSAPSGAGSSGPASAGSDAAPAPSGGAVSGDVWARLAQCESGGNPSIVSASGTYHGLYQFSVATWRSVGGSGLPSQASPAEQTQRAQALQARSGWGQWPACAAKLGLY